MLKGDNCFYIFVVSHNIQEMYEYVDFTAGVQLGIEIYEVGPKIRRPNKQNFLLDQSAFPNDFQLSNFFHV